MAVRTRGEQRGEVWRVTFVVVDVMSPTVSGDVNRDNTQYKANVSAMNASQKWFILPMAQCLIA